MGDEVSAWELEGALPVPWVQRPHFMAEASVAWMALYMSVAGHQPFWWRQWHPTPVLLPGKSHRWRSLVGYSPWGHEESDTTSLSLSHIGEGKGNPLQCSCLENPRDGGAWWAAVCGAAQSQTQLKWLSSSSSSLSESASRVPPHWHPEWCHWSQPMMACMQWGQRGFQVQGSTCKGLETQPWQGQLSLVAWTERGDVGVLTSQLRTLPRNNPGLGKRPQMSCWTSPFPSSFEAAAPRSQPCWHRLLPHPGSIRDHLTCLLQNLYADQVRTGLEQQTGSKLGKEYVKAVYCHTAYLTYMQSTSWETLGWMKHKLESRLPGEISITPDMQMIPPLWQKVKN